MMFDTLGYASDHPDAAIAWQAVHKLLVVEQGPSLLPAVPVADLGHQPGRPRDGEAGGRHRTPPANGSPSGKSPT